MNYLYLVTSLHCKSWYKGWNGLSLTSVIRTHKLLSLLQDMEVTANELRKVLNRFMSKREYIWGVKSFHRGVTRTSEWQKGVT